MTLTQRSSGLLLHITSLPSDFGIGDLGPCSHRFVDLLAQAKQRVWSILPLNPTSAEYGNSPYQALSAFAGNTLLLSPELFVEDRLLSEADIEKLRLRSRRVDFEAVAAKKKIMLRKAYSKFVQKGENSSQAFKEFCSRNSSWLDDYSLYLALRDYSNLPWYEWPSHLRGRDPSFLAQKRAKLEKCISKEKFAQFQFERQWDLLKRYCQAKAVQIMGDLSFYVAYDSADVWSHSELFKLDSKKKQRYVGGVPPDLFSEKGQLWGNPVYNWPQLKSMGFKWWIERIRKTLHFCDLIRLDHFRGFTAYWQIPPESKKAKGGKWVRAPSKSFFSTLKSTFPNLPFVAEDLGVITGPVKSRLKELRVPGMKVLLFGFDGSKENPNLPSNYVANSVVYTGTHDTNTVKGWFSEEATDDERNRVFEYLRGKVSNSRISHEFVKLAVESKSNLSIIPVQDVLNLGSEARMNYPSRMSYNWVWKMKNDQLRSKNFENLAEFTQVSGRN